MTFESGDPVPQPDAPRERAPAWPVVLGVLSIVAGWRAWRTLGFTSPRVALFMVKSIMKTGFPSLGQLLPPGLAVALVLCLLASVSGMLGGVLLLLRRRRALHLHWLYVIAGTGAVIVFVVCLWQQAGQWRDAFPQTWRRHVYDALKAQGLALVYPVLVLVWFCRGRVRREVDCWRTSEARRASKPVYASWPTVLGWLAVFWGATGLLSSILSLVGAAVFPLPGPPPGRLHALGYQTLRWSQPALSALSLAWGLLLLRRRPAAFPLCMVYAAGKLAVAVAGPALMVAGSFARSGLSLDAIVVTATRIAPGMIWPAFLLVWLARPGIRAQVKAWPVERVEGLEPAGDARATETATMGRDSPAPPRENGTRKWD